MNTQQLDTEAYGVTVHRRGASRLRLESEARFYGIGGNRPIVLLDISQSGAKFRFNHGFGDQAGFLKWLEYETFGEVIWRNDTHVGVKFDEWLPHDWLLATRTNSEHINLVKKRKAKNAAREWVVGRV